MREIKNNIIIEHGQHPKTEHYIVIEHEQYQKTRTDHWLWIAMMRSDHMKKTSDYIISTRSKGWLGLFTDTLPKQTESTSLTRI